MVDQEIHRQLAQLKEKMVEMEPMLELQQVAVAEVRLPEPGSMPASGYEGEGWVVLRDRSTAKVAEALRRLVTLIRVELG